MATTKYSYGLGRRKAATARVRLYKGKGEITSITKLLLTIFLAINHYLPKLLIH